MLLYGSECWRIVKRDINKVNVFHNSCLRRICNIFWPNKISNNDLYQKTGCTSMDLEIKKRRLRWLGDVLRMSSERIPKVALRWTPAGKRKGEDPKPPGGRQWKLNLVRWVCHGERHRQFRKTRPGGKETEKRHCCGPMPHWGAIRTNIYIFICCRDISM